MSSTAPHIIQITPEQQPKAFCSMPAAATVATATATSSTVPQKAWTTRKQQELSPVYCSTRTAPATTMTNMAVVAARRGEFMTLSREDVPWGQVQYFPFISFAFRTLFEYFPPFLHPFPSCFIPFVFFCLLLSFRSFLFSFPLPPLCVVITYSLFGNHTCFSFSHPCVPYHQLGTVSFQ
jgi:hypothetical protein